MKKVLVSGLINIESSIDVYHFPIDYSPIEYAFNGLNSCVSGVGYNVSLALKKLGDEYHLQTLDNYNNLGLNELTVNTMLDDGVHPSEIGIYRIAKYLGRNL